MTRVAVMQPYAFPYLGYIQLMHAVDHYIFLNDVSWRKKGWINRNTLKDGYKFTFPIQNASQNKTIKETIISVGWAEKFKKTIYHKYKNAPYFVDFRDDVGFVIDNMEGAEFSKATETAVTNLAHICGVRTNYNFSAEIEEFANADFSSLKAEKKIKRICEHLKADTYINAIGGKDLDFYTPEFFSPIKLRFLKPKFELPSTSILDLLFTYGPKRIRIELDKYELIEK